MWKNEVIVCDRERAVSLHEAQSDCREGALQRREQSVHRREEEVRMREREVEVRAGKLDEKERVLEMGGIWEQVAAGECAFLFGTCTRFMSGY